MNVRANDGQPVVRDRELGRAAGHRRDIMASSQRLLGKQSAGLAIGSEYNDSHGCPTLLSW
jgi:hypothetical protein